MGVCSHSLAKDWHQHNGIGGEERGGRSSGDVRGEAQGTVPKTAFGRGAECDVFVLTCDRYWMLPLQGGFAPYVKEVAEIMVQSLGFLFHDGVRTGAAAALAPLLTCAVCRPGPCRQVGAP